jgi:hypothetical protein
VVIAAVGPANAQSTLSRDEMNALKAQINALQQEVRELRGKVNKAEQTAQKAQAGQKSYAAAPGAPKAPPTPPSTAVAKMSPAFRPSICSVDLWESLSPDRPSVHWFEPSPSGPAPQSGGTVLGLQRWRSRLSGGLG